MGGARVGGVMGEANLTIRAGGRRGSSPTGGRGWRGATTGHLRPSHSGCPTFSSGWLRFCRLEGRKKG